MSMIVIPSPALPADIDMRAGAIGQIDVQEGFAFALRAQCRDDQRQSFGRDGRDWLDEGDIRPRWSGDMLRPGRGVPGPEWQGRQCGCG